MFPYNINFLINYFREDKVNYVFSKAEWEIEKTRPEKNWPSKGTIEFKTYSVRYRNELGFALRDISFKISSGEKV